MTKLRAPETCPNGHGRHSCHIIDSRVVQPTGGTAGYRRRRHKCNVCEERWTSYQSLLNPHRIRVTHKQSVVAAAS